MKLSFNNITKQLTDYTIEGGILYAADKGFKVLRHVVSGYMPAAIPSPVQSILTAVGYAFLVDAMAPQKYAKLAGAVAMAEVIAGFADPIVDPMLVKSNLVGLGSLSTASSYALAAAGGTLPAGSTAPMLGYGRVGGYASVRGGMGGYGALAGAVPGGGKNFLGLEAGV